MRTFPTRNGLTVAVLAALALAMAAPAATAAPTRSRPADSVSVERGTTERARGTTERAGTAGLAGCRAGQWNQVAWFVHPFWPEGHWYVADQPWIQVNWRWFSGGPIPYLEGSFTGRAHISAPPSPYTSIEFWCSVDTNIQVV